jgi:phospholipid/cholesterol/gamma-HCH transport system substrate-binding protein
LACLQFPKTHQSVDQTLSNVTSLSSNLNNTVMDLDQKMKSKDNTLGLFLSDRSLYDNINSTVANADSLVIDLKAHPKRYVHFSVFGKKDK